MQLDVDVDCICKGKDIVDPNVSICPFCPHPVSDPKVAERRAHHEAASQMQRPDPAEGKRTCVCCTFAMLREPGKQRWHYVDKEAEG